MMRGCASIAARCVRRGTTLLEVLVAAFLLGTVLLVALEAIGRSATAQAEAERVVEMANLAQTKMEEILKEPELPEGRQESGDFSDLQPEYAWEAAIETSEHPGLVQVIVRISERDASGTPRANGRTYSLTALRRPSISAPAAEATAVEP
ncbi:MAG: type II secretion system protein [Armatimonadetes bacterium]|nr:type II secretion system protein [Armatimonadota bacterium]